METCIFECFFKKGIHSAHACGIRGNAFVEKERNFID